MISKKAKNANLKGENNIFITILKAVIILALIAFQIAEFLVLYNTTKQINNYTAVLFEILKLCITLYILYRHSNTSYKLSWVVFIAFFPAAAIVVYLLWGNSELRKKKEKSLNNIEQESKKYLEDTEKEKELLDFDKARYLQAKYIKNVTGYPCCEGEDIKYFDSGESFFKDLLQDLKNAKQYILMEFFLISKGTLWNQTLDILKQKVAEGVKVTILVDDFGSLLRRPKNFAKVMKECGIELVLFNPFDSFVNGYFNYRDHRKIVVIDGIIAYTCGMNLADEYANIIERYGHWKDSGIKISGKPAFSFTVMLLRALQSCSKKPIDYNWYRDVRDICLNTVSYQKRGYAISYCDGPNNKKNPIENIYLQMINDAKDYVYITTPYLIIDEPMLYALMGRARSGVDVKIILPHIPDKKIVNIVTKSYYQVLLEAGVKIYEYEPGFIHSKSIVSDDCVATIGSANLDFRSFHINFECGIWTYKTGAELSIRKDFENTLKKCININYLAWKKRNIFIKIIEAVLSAFAPMM